jgi:putative metallohydrolase (TIGR04338 family)
VIWVALIWVALIWVALIWVGDLGGSDLGGSVPGGSQRDSQRSKVYAAENQVGRLVDARGDYPTLSLFGSAVVVPDDRKFGDLDSVQRFVDAVLGLNWVIARWPAVAGKRVRVRARAGARRAHYDPATATIALPPFTLGGKWALRELVVLHELAHHVTDPVLAPHGPEFAGNVLVLVAELMGPEAEFLLRTTYLSNGVRIH